MNDYELISYGIIAGGSLMTLYAGYKILHRGFIFWVIMILIGISAVNYGLAKKNNVSLEDFLEELNPAKLSQLSKDKLANICGKIEQIPQD